MSGGTDNHLMLVDLRPLGLTAKKAEKALNAVGITVNKNTIPYDPEKPGTASGIRVGTPAVTTRGMREAEMERIGASHDRSMRRETRRSRRRSPRKCSISRAASRYRASRRNA